MDGASGALIHDYSGDGLRPSKSAVLVIVVEKKPSRWNNGPCTELGRMIIAGQVQRKRCAPGIPQDKRVNGKWPHYHFSSEAVCSKTR